MSVDLGQLLEEADKELDAMVPQGFGAVAIHIGIVRGHGLEVGSDPEPQNPYHGQIWGVKNNKYRKVQDAVAGWVIGLDGVSLT
jgi:hypothetical protein